MTVQEAIKDIQRQLAEIESEDADITISTDSLIVGIEALEKQVAKRVIGIKAKLITRHCPSCQEWAVFELKRGMKFCPSCGQKLDWSEEE